MVVVRPIIDFEKGGQTYIFRWIDTPANRRKMQAFIAEYPKAHPKLNFDSNDANFMLGIIKDISKVKKFLGLS